VREDEFGSADAKWSFYGALKFQRAN